MAAEEEQGAQLRALPGEPKLDPALDHALAEGQRRLDQLIAIGTALDGAIDATSLAEALLPHLVPSFADLAALGRVDTVGDFLPWSRLTRSGDQALPDVRLTVEDLATIEGGGWLAVSFDGGQGGGVVLPLLRGGRLHGILLLVRRSGAFDMTEIAFAGEVARRAALTLDALRLRGEVREALAARDHFLAVAAHELRTPLTALRAHAQLLARRREGGRLDGRWLGTALVAFEHATSELEQIVVDLLDVARLRLGQVPVHRQVLDLVPLVREVTERQRAQLSDRQRLATILPTGQCFALVDPGHLEQVLVELLDNAAKFSPGGGTIRVGLEPDGVGVRLTVRDEGIGLTPGSTEAIFEPFGRAANAGMRQVRGLGLGLHRCRELITRNGGQIRAESGGEGAGTAMHCWLPRDEA